MPGYITKVLAKLNHKPQIYPQYSPHKHIQIKWSQKNDRQYAQQEDTSPLLDPKGTKYIQSAVGSLLYYARAIDSTMLPALNQIGTQQAQPTENTKQAVQQLLDNANTYKNGIIRYFIPVT